MASYGYGGGASYGQTTMASYGAGGGGDDGGFMTGGGGGQSGSQESPGGGGARNYTNESMRPVTIKQLIDATQPHPKAEFKIDGTDVTNLCFIGQVVSVLAQATNTTYRLHDGTGLIEVKKWIDGTAVEAEQADPMAAPRIVPTEGQYVAVFGRLKDYHGKRHIAASVVRPIENFNEISVHLLRATAAHLYFTRGPPESQQKPAGGADDNEMFVGGGTAGGGAAALPAAPRLSKATSMGARKLFALLETTDQSMEGLSLNDVVAQTTMLPNDVLRAADELISGGVIYTTVDNETWAILEY